MAADRATLDMRSYNGRPKPWYLSSSDPSVCIHIRARLNPPTNGIKPLHTRTRSWSFKLPPRRSSTSEHDTLGVDFERDGDDEFTPADLAVVDAAARIIDSASQLTKLSLHLEFVYDGLDYTALSGCLMLASSLTRIQTLELNAMRVTKEALLECPTRCSPTLTTLKIETVAIMCRDDAWKVALRYVADMPRLERLGVHRISECDGDPYLQEDPFWHLQFQGGASVDFSLGG